MQELMSYYPNLRIGFTGAITFRDRDKGCSLGSVILLVLSDLENFLGTRQFVRTLWWFECIPVICLDTSGPLTWEMMNIWVI